MARKPAGIDSGVALREYSDIETERFLCTGQRYDQFFLDVARIMIELTRDLAASNKKLSIRVVAGKSMDDLQWLRDIDLKRDQYIMRSWGTAFLPTTPAAKLQFIQEMIKTGFVSSKEHALSLLDYPDLEEFISTQTVALDSVRRVIARILNKGEYTPPSKYMNLELAIQLAQAALLQGQDDGRPQERLDLLAQFLDESAAELDRLTAPPATPPPDLPPGEPPPLQGEAPPIPPEGAPPMAA